MQGRNRSKPQLATPPADQVPDEAEGCQLGEIFDLLSKAHMLDIFHLLSSEVDRPLRFGEIQDLLDLSPRTLSERLKALTSTGLVDRRSYNEVPPRVEYEATAKARELGGIFDDIKGWTERHDLRSDEDSPQDPPRPVDDRPRDRPDP